MRQGECALVAAPAATAPDDFSRLARRNDWPERLIQAASYHNGAFAWGKRDCATLFSEAVTAVVGVDPLARFKPWQSEADAMRRLARSGYTSVCGLIEALFDEIQPADARRGDIGYAGDVETLSCPAVIVGSTAMSLTATGVVIFPRTLLQRAFRVGR